MKIDRLNWSLLYTYLIIVEEKSLSLAALKLNVTQSAVSQSLRRLEESLEVKLIERSNKQFYLTKHGEYLHKVAIDIYSKLVKVEQRLEAGNNYSQDVLNIMMVTGVVSEPFDRLLTYFHQHYPNVQLKVTAMSNAEIIKKLSTNHPSVALTLDPKGHEDIESVFYFPQRYSFYCGKSHALFNKTEIMKSDVISQDYVIFESEQLGAALSPIAIFRDMEHFSGKVAAIANNLYELRRLIMAGYGIGCLPDNAAEKEVSEGRLRKLPPYQGVADIPVYFSWAKKRKLRAIEHAFIDAASIVLEPL